MSFKVDEARSALARLDAPTLWAFYRFVSASPKPISGPPSPKGAEETGLALEQYRFTVEPLSEDDGGGFFVTLPDLPGCFADGDTVDEAIESARDAFEAWMRAQEKRDFG